MSVAALRPALCREDGCNGCVAAVALDLTDVGGARASAVVDASPVEFERLRPGDLYGKILVPDSVVEPARVISQHTTLGELPPGTVHRVHRHKES